jgi:hypothetical protein
MPKKLIRIGNRYFNVDAISHVEIRNPEFVQVYMLDKINLDFRVKEAAAVIAALESFTAEIKIG